MGDSTSASFVLWHASPKKKRKIEDFLTDLTADVVALELGDWFEFGHDVRCGIVNENAEDLIKLAPKAIWQFYETPKYEWLGSCAWYHPQVGLYEAECDANGKPVMGFEEIAGTGILAGPESPDFGIKALLVAQEKLAALLGQPQRDAIAESNQVKAQTVS